MSKDVGRNDPCPCGSGLKFKKCCIDQPLNLFPHHTPERSIHWSQAEISVIPTNKIIEKLAMCSIPFSQDEFLIDVHNHYGAGEIYKEWKKRYRITTTGFDGDFPWMAADVLWRRLAPEKISTEQLDDMIQEGYDLIGKRDPVGGCTVWLKVWDELKLRFTPEMKTVEDTEPIIQGIGSQGLFNWCQDMEMELGNAAIDDKAFHDHRIRYCREFIGFFPESHNILHNLIRAIAESFYMSGRIEEAEQEFQTLVTKYPSDPWSYASWGDMYADVDGGTYNPEKAEELYRKALGLEPSEDKYLHDRIRELKQG